MSQSLEFKIPEGYVFDKDNSTDEVIRFKPKKITYTDICRELFLSKPSWRLLENGTAKHADISDSAITYLTMVATSHKQLKQLVALNKLMNVGKYLNGDWKPDFTDIEERKWYINYDFENLMLGAYFVHTYRHSHAYFKSEELALQVIEILGEDEVKKALGIFE